MKKSIVFFVIWLLTAGTIHAQKWDQLKDEEKLAKLKSFRAENQKYLKDSLHLTQTQMTDVDNVNLCFLSTLDRIDRYAKDEASKEKYADALWEVRWAQLDAIMGKDKHERYATYLERRVEKAMQKNK